MSRDFLVIQETLYILIRPGTQFMVPGLIKIREVLPSGSCGPRKSLVSKEPQKFGPKRKQKGPTIGCPFYPLTATHENDQNDFSELDNYS